MSYFIQFWVLLGKVPILENRKLLFCLPLLFSIILQSQDSSSSLTRNTADCSQCRSGTKAWQLAGVARLPLDLVHTNEGYLSTVLKPSCPSPSRARNAFLWHLSIGRIEKKRDMLVRLRGGWRPFSRCEWGSSESHWQYKPFGFQVWLVQCIRSHSHQSIAWVNAVAFWYYSTLTVSSLILSQPPTKSKASQLRHLSEGL